MVKHNKYLLISFCSIIFILASSFLFPALSQNTPPKAEESIPILLSDREYFLSIAVLTFGLVVIICEVILLKEAKGSSDNILLVIVTTLIVIGGLFIITAGLTTEQVAPAFGLYGAIVGYLLGKESRSEKK